ncbi:hypothetical protein QFZ78_005623 [Paenibacillus sp. V4I5]|nr:hypothetical protein [Paenibacillus sp. V4I5]
MKATQIPKQKTAKPSTNQFHVEVSVKKPWMFFLISPAYPWDGSVTRCAEFVLYFLKMNL